MGLEKEDKSWKQLPTACTFTGNRIVRTKPHQKPLVIPGRVRDLTARDNIACDPEAKRMGRVVSLGEG